MRQNAKLFEVVKQLLDIQRHVARATILIGVDMKVQEAITRFLYCLCHAYFDLESYQLVPQIGAHLYEIALHVM